MLFRSEGEMLAAAEADLEMERPRIAEQAGGVDRAGVGYGDRRQQLLEQGGLTGAQLVPGTAAVKAADGTGIVHVAGLISGA